MRAICVDDEPLAVEYTLGQCAALSQIDEAKGFTNAKEALVWLHDHPVDVALLDIDMPHIDGITLAARIKEMRPHTAILFLTAHKSYAFDAYAVHPVGYLLKPVSQKRLAEEVDYVCGNAKCLVSASGPARIQVRTFGNFDVFVGSEPVSFRLAKAKEILAYLVDRQGAGVTRAELFSAVWEGLPYDRRMQKQLDVYVRSLRDTLREYGIGQMVQMRRGVLRVDPNVFDCDAYRFFAGEGDAVNAYRGEYMSSYSWANLTEGLLYQKATNHPMR